MAPLDSPFSNLDVWCDWCGDVDAPVEVTVSVEVSKTATRGQQKLTTISDQVWCTPNSQISVLNAQPASIVEIVEYDLKPKTVKAEQDADNGDAMEDTPVDNDEKVPVSPTEHATYQETEYASSLTDVETPSNSGSVIIRSLAPDVQPDSTPCSRLSSSLWADLTNYESPSSSLIPRKRGVDSASLPSSVSDSERTYGGHKHRIKQPSESPLSSSLSGLPKRQSHIPRPVRRPGHVRSESIITASSLSPKSTCVLERDFERFEGLKSTSEKLENVDQTREVRSATEISCPVTPKSTGSLPAVVEGKMAGLYLERLSKLSTAVSRSSPCDMSALSSETGSPFSEVNSENSPPEEVTIVQRSEPILLPESANTPLLEFVDGLFSIQCPFNLKPAAYEVSITLRVRLQKGCPRGWWELVLSGLPHLSSMDHGYVYFRTPSDQGIEFRTTPFKRHTLVEGCLMAQFLVPTKVVIPFRLCDAQFYGVVKDFKVTQTIGLLGVGDGVNGNLSIARYVAIFSIKLIQRDISSKECAIFVYVHGGPPGQFSCRLEPTQKLPVIMLNSGHAARSGVCEVQIRASPSNLETFVMKWSVIVPRAMKGAWVPHIKATNDHIGEDLLQDRFQSDLLNAKDFDSCEIVWAKANSLSGNVPESQILSPKKTAWWQRVLRFFWCLSCISVFLSMSYRFLELSGCCETAKKLVCFAPANNVEVDHDEVPVRVTVAFASGSDTQSAVKIPVTTSMPLRDRIDYFLGWKGPVAGV